MTARQEKLAELFKAALVIPVLTIERLEDAVPLARALVAGGVRVLEHVKSNYAPLASPLNHSMHGIALVRANSMT